MRERQTRETQTRERQERDRQGRDKRDTVCLIFITPIILKRFEDVMAREEEKRR